MSLLNHVSHPILSLAVAFTAWKALLLSIALGASVGPDYDTSTSLFFDVVQGAATPVPALAARLTRWDAVYFMHDAHVGKVYEQEWAFGVGLPLVGRAIGDLLAKVGVELSEAIIAISISHLSHLIAVLALYQLTIVISNDRKLAFLAAVVHILSPAGLFLSAPYAESSFSCLSFVGNLLFAISLKAGPDSLKRNTAVAGAGLMYGVASTFRSNGLFGGILFAVEVVSGLVALANGFSISKVLRLVAPVVGGILVAVGFAAPQVDVGFLKYWTPNQIPLFILAAPMLTILIKSGIELVGEPSRGLRTMAPGTNDQCRLLVRTLAVMQTLLAVLAITNYHVQIISRLSSGYPVWYWWVASCFLDKQRQGLGYGVVVFITMYAAIQGAVQPFASVFHFSSSPLPSFVTLLLLHQPLPSSFSAQSTAKMSSNNYHADHLQDSCPASDETLQKFQELKERVQTCLSEARAGPSSSSSAASFTSSPSPSPSPSSSSCSSSSSSSYSSSSSPPPPSPTTATVTATIEAFDPWTGVFPQGMEDFIRQNPYWSPEWEAGVPAFCRPLPSPGPWISSGSSDAATSSSPRTS
ncbi:hypothetical protein FDECE_2975 [Fusarium decemcellulare]|nr:hypothetical protein FDECE_2975 [Fusarium decemcellulare]